MNDCIFCKIVAGEIPAEKIYEDEHTLAFLDLKPVNPGHTLVIPKEHSRNIFDIEPESAQHLIKTVRKVASAIKEGVSAGGINIHVNNEAPAGQVVFHTHIHLIPRFLDDDIKMWQGRASTSEERKTTLKQIKNHLPTA